MTVSHLGSVSLWWPIVGALAPERHPYVGIYTSDSVALLGPPPMVTFPGTLWGPPAATTPPHLCLEWEQRAARPWGGGRGWEGAALPCSFS